MTIVRIMFCCLLITCSLSWAEDYYSFSNSLIQANNAATSGNIPAAVKFYGDAEHAEASNSARLCVLTHRYFDLTYFTNSPSAQKSLLERATHCSLRAVNADSNNPTAHACVAVCYAKLCTFADIKTKLNYSRLFKLEAEKAIALDPKQDLAYYLLGRWNYGVANVGLFSRALVKVIYGGLPKASNESAIANFKKAIALAPNRILYHSGLAMVYETIGNKDLEIAELKKCRDLTPTDLEDKKEQHNAIRKLAELGQ